MKKRESEWLIGGGEMGKLVRSMDWSKTALGARELWPQSLRTTVSLCLASNFPMSIAWGPERIQIYNDGYWPICGSKHPVSMGQDFRICWASPWPAIGEAFEAAVNGETRFIEDQRMFLDRHGYIEETFFTFSFSPIRDEAGHVGGLFHPVTELTQQLLAERRLRVLRSIGDATGEARTVQEACASLERVFQENDLDLPFTLLYLIDRTTQQAVLSARSGLVTDPGGWPVGAVAASGQAVVQSLSPGLLGTAPVGPYPEPPRAAMVLPILVSGRDDTFAVLVAGVSARRPLDESYRSFFRLVADVVASALSGARIYEEERKRAEALAELDRAKTTFFSNVSHGFRTPLTLVLGPLESVLQALEPGSPHADALSSVHRNALRLMKLVNTLLDFSRIEAGRAQASFRPVDLATYTRELASSFESAAVDAGLRLIIRCDPSVPPVYVDVEMWEKIVLNLISNAMKFTLRGEVEVDLDVSGDNVFLTVRDTGSGIPAGELHRVFERFYRIRTSHSRSHEGTGIGLALTQELIRLHGGSIKAESQEGAGTTFTVSLPLGFAHLPEGQVNQEPGMRDEAMPATPQYLHEAVSWLPSEKPRIDAVPGRELVLLADDNQDMRDYVSALLRERWNVQVVTDGQAALEAATADPPDLVLTDVMMPRLDGVELLYALRADPRTKGIPVILLSARAGEEAKIAGLHSGADDYLVKPFSARELMARVASHLSLARLRRELEEAKDLSEERLHAQRLEAMGKLSAGVAHDFNNLLTVINGYADLVLDDPLDERHRDAVQEMKKCGARAVALVQQLTAFSRRQVMELRPIDLDDLVARLGGMLARLLGEKIQIEVDVKPGCCTVRADESQLEQVIVNLAVNARDAMRGGGQLFLRTSSREFSEPQKTGGSELPAGRYCCLGVRDTGEGMSPAVLQHAFEPFYTTKPKGRGTGLGLSTVYGIVRQLGGAVEVHSTEGVGTEFSLWLPIADAQELRPAPPAPVPGTLRSRATILLVEDDAGVRRFSAGILRSRGHDVLEAEDAESALALLAENPAPFHLVIADAILPMMSGVELVEAVRTHRPGVPALIVSGYIDQELVARLERSPRTAFLAKPYTAAILLEQVGTVIAAAGSTDG